MNPLCIKPIKLAITFFSGFLQSFGSPGSGLGDLENDVHYLVHKYPQIKVRLYPWKTDVSDVAESLWRLRNGLQKHVVVGYSYGGQTAVNFVEQLQLRSDLRVSHLVMCDAVRRWKCLPGVAAVTGLGKFKIPPIVEKLTWFRQRNPRWKINRAGDIFQPAGHDIKTNVKPILKTAGHSYIDNDSDFRRLVIDIIESELAVYES